MKIIAQNVFLLILCTGLLSAQEPSKEEMEKIQSLRIAFLSQQWNFRQSRPVVLAHFQRIR